MRRLLCLLAASVLSAPIHLRAPSALNAALIDHHQATVARLDELKREGYNAAILLVDESDGIATELAAAKRILDSTLQLHYWLDIGRNRTLAKAHPEWMASLQTHNEWRRHFPNFPTEAKDEVVKNFPWVPVLNKEGFDAHLERTTKVLAALPPARSVFLNHLQGAPSACGCGNSFCRWTADYGPKKTATTLGPDAASLFLAAVKKVAGGAEIVPIWTTECAEHDEEHACGSVPCFRGLCWKEYAKQLNPVAKEAKHIGVLLPFEDFPGHSKTGPATEWQAIALKSFTEVVPKKGGAKITLDRLIAVIQGQDVSPADLQTQRARSTSIGVTNVIVTLTRLDSSWEPRLLKRRP